MARLSKLSVFAVLAALLVAFVAPVQAIYYGRAVVGRGPRGNVGFYGRTTHVAPYSRYSRSSRVVVVGHRHLLQDEEAASEPEPATAAPSYDPALTDDAASASDEGSCMTLSELLEERKDEFSLLIKAIEKLPQEFKDEMTTRADESDFTYTFFAPTDEAVERFTAWLGEDVKDSEFVKNGTAALAILSYHIVPDTAAKSTDLTDGMTLETALGEEFPLQVKMEEGSVMLKGIGSAAKVIEADLPTCKGVVHVIDDVLLPADGDGELEDDQLKSAVKEEIDRLVAGGEAEAQPAGEGDEAEAQPAGEDNEAGGE